MYRLRHFFVSGLAAVAFCLVSTSIASAQAFPVAGEDIFTSTAAMRIKDIHGNLVFEGILGSSTVPNTIVARSDAFSEDSGLDVNGAVVGNPTSTFTVADSDIKVFPSAFKEIVVPPQSATHEVHTEIVSLDLAGPKGSGVRIRAGRGLTISATLPLTRSLGEVESLSPDGSSDFPAKSFFDVFVLVDVNVTGTTMTLYNKSPLVIECGTGPNPTEGEEVTSFPPRCKYLHTLGEANGNAIKLFNAANSDPKAPPIFFLTSAVHGAGVAVTTKDLPPDRSVAIKLISFTAEASAKTSVVLTWETGSEIDNAGFNLYRASSASGPWTRVNPELIPANGDPVAGTDYSYVDTPGEGTFYYELEDVDTHGVSTRHGPVRIHLGPTAAAFDVHLYIPMMTR